jgi:hypothetical protein
MFGKVHGCCRWICDVPQLAIEVSRHPCGTRRWHHALVHDRCANIGLGFRRLSTAFARGRFPGSYSKRPRRPRRVFPDRGALRRPLFWKHSDNARSGSQGAPETTPLPGDRTVLHPRVRQEGCTATPPADLLEQRLERLASLRIAQLRRQSLEPLRQPAERVDLVQRLERLARIDPSVYADHCINLAFRLSRRRPRQSQGAKNLSKSWRSADRFVGAPRIETQMRFTASSATASFQSAFLWRAVKGFLGSKSKSLTMVVDAVLANWSPLRTIPGERGKNRGSYDFERQFFRRRTTSGRYSRALLGILGLTYNRGRTAHIRETCARVTEPRSAPNSACTSKLKGLLPIARFNQSTQVPCTI